MIPDLCFLSLKIWQIKMVNILGDWSVFRLTLFCWCPMDFIDFFWQRELQFALHFERGGEGRMDGEAGLWCQKLLLIATRMVDRSTKMQFCILRYNRIAYVGMFVICFNVLCLNFRSSNSLLFNRQQKVIFCEQTILMYWLGYLPNTHWNA